MTTFDWGAFARVVETAEQQFHANAPLPAAAGKEGGLVAALAAAQPVVTEANSFVATRPGAITAALTLLRGLQAQNLTWAGELADILSQVASALPTASADLSGAIGVLKAFQPEPTWRPGPTPDDPR